MSGLLAFVIILFITAAIAWAVGAILAAVCTSLLGVLKSTPSATLRRCMMIGLLPTAMPAVLVLSVGILAAAKPLGLIADHCLYHGPGHPHLCLSHLPAISPGTVLSLLVFALLASLVFIIWRHAIRQSRLLSELSSMASLARGTGPLRILTDKRKLAFATSAPQPLILMTSGMLDNLDRHQRRIVLAHEVAHLRHRDLVWNRVFEWLLLLQLPWISCTLRSIWQQAIEERADDVVVARFGRDNVAMTLLTLARPSAMQSAQALCVSGGNTLDRIERLLSPTTAGRKSKFFEMTYAIGLLAIPTFVIIAHHALETFVGLLLGT